MVEAWAGGWSALQWLALVEHELLLFTLFWFIVGSVDEALIDLTWLWLRLTGRARTPRLAEDYSRVPLLGPIAVLIPAWQEAAVIGATLRHALAVWPQRELRLYVGCYRNDTATIIAAMKAAGEDARVRLVIHDRPGPSTKADCLNRLYAALRSDEGRSGSPFRAVVLQDAEDMVHPDALVAIDRALETVDFVQLPVRPELDPASRWISSHYADEFTEAHAKTMVVRDAVGAAIPAAGVGCGIARAALSSLAVIRRMDGAEGPFAAECLTEDYEMGLVLSRVGRGGRFLRLRDSSGQLVATRSYFPASLPQAVRQKTRWIHGIALQSWDRLGWTQNRPVDVWMAMRDRRGPLTALVFALAYLLLVLDATILLAHQFGSNVDVVLSPMLRGFLMIGFAGLIWRAVMRFVFTTREYGPAEGLRAVLRIPVSNIIAIMAGRRALAAYVATLRGKRIEWDKTAHEAHPASMAQVHP